MRGPACFSNCSPSPAPVTISQITNNYHLSADRIVWRQDRLAYADFTALTGDDRNVSNPETAAVLIAEGYYTLSRTPNTPYSVQVGVGIGSPVPQRPLISYAASWTSSDPAYDYFVVGNKLYVNFTPAPATVIFVSFVGLSETGDPTALETGAMDVIDIDAGLPEGWIYADGTTFYSQLSFASLFAKLRDEGNDIMIYYSGEGETAEQYASDAEGKVLLATSGAVVPPGAFVIRYLEPYTYAPLQAPGTWLDGTTVKPLYRVRSATHRVVVKV